MAHHPSYFALILPMAIISNLQRRQTHRFIVAPSRTTVARSRSQQSSFLVERLSGRRSRLVSLGSPKARLRVLPLPNFSGPIDELSVRPYGPYRGGLSLSLSDLIVPVADALSVILDSVGIEHKDPIRVGATLADDTTGLRQQDDSTGIGNNNRPQIVLVVPLDTPVSTNEITGTVVPVVDGRPDERAGSAEVISNGTSRTFTITKDRSSDGDLTQLAQELLDLVEEDIRVTLGSFSATNRPGKTDKNGFIDVTATTLDVGSGLFSTSETSYVLSLYFKPSLIPRLSLLSIRTGRSQLWTVRTSR
jgi:hypothetical protein